MEESRSPAEINSIDCFNKKRKLEEELLELPLSKHACWHRNPIVIFPSDCYNTEPNKSESDQSDQESGKDSNSFHYNNSGDSIMSTGDEFKTDLQYPEIYEPSTSSSWAGKSSEIQLYPSNSRSLTKSNPSQTESLSLNEQINYPYYQSETEPSLNYDEHLEEFENHDVEESVEEPGNYVLSSGRWSVNNQDTEQERNQLTIDKEFEQYFSMLMM